MTPAERAARRERKRTGTRVLGQRLRRRRLEAGLTVQGAAEAAGFEKTLWSAWEVGSKPYPILDLAALAAALAVPIAALLTDELVLAEVRVSPETLESVKRGGRPAAREVVERLAGNLEALLLAEASRPAVDLRPGARAKPRRSREQLLAAKEQGIAAGRRFQADQAAKRRRSRVASEAA